MNPQDTEEPKQPASQVSAVGESQIEPGSATDPIDTAEPGQWSYSGSDVGSSAQPGVNSPATQTISWTASEYVGHQKSAAWFGALGMAILAMTIAIYFMTKEVISAVMVAIFGGVFGVFAARQPEVLEYSLNNSGLQVGPKFYSYDRFKSFSVIEEGPIRSILLMPLQRFMPSLTIYYDPNDEDKIVYVLGSYLPHEDRAHDMLDRLMRKIRF